MTEPQSHLTESAALRQQAERRSQANTAQTPIALSPEDTQHLLHELQVHQIELEMQNDELRRMQAKLESSQARYFDLYDQAPVGYVTFDEQGVIREANLTAATLLGVTRNALVRQLLSQFIFKEDQGHYYLFRKKLFEAPSAGPGPAGAPQVCELRLLKKDAPPFWARLETGAAQGADGAPVCRVVLSDITESKQIEQAQVFLVHCGYTGENFFEALARYLSESLGMVYVCIDRLLGDRLTAQTVAIYFDGKFEPNVAYTLNDTPCGDVVGKAICCFPEKVRHLFPRDAVLQEMRAESYVGATLWSSQGQPIGLIAVIGRQPLANPRLAEAVLKLVAVRAAGELERQQAEEDLRQLNAELEQRIEERTAELTQTNRELVRAMRAKDEFLAGMSHELRTPLTAVLGLSEALQLNLEGSLTDKQLHYVRLIYESGEHLLTLINDVLDLAKVSAGRLDLQDDVVNVVELCRVVIHLVSPQAGKKHLTVSLTSDPAVTVIQGDLRRLKQILVNLLGNAVKFTPVGGKVGLMVAGDKQQRRVNFTVWDTGLGIAREDLPRLFQDFVQLDARLAREYEGTGLGLAMVRRLVELHGGQVRAESDGVGHGSRFTVSLPWEPESSASKGLEEPAKPPQSLSASVTSAAPVILVVDDQPALLLAIQGILKATVYRVESIQDSRTALAQARALRPALMLVDIQMPHLDGLELIRQIRADVELATLPIIALTALAMPDDRERCLRAGANDYLSKPVKADELLRAISAWPR